MSSFDKIYILVSKVPKGKVTTYGALSVATGVNPRVVGYALHANKNPENIPCHRVINSKGQISSGFAFGGQGKQKEMLKKEGIKFDKPGDAVDLQKFGFFLF